ncbi:hypothetical protein L916_07559 [Phytophthora nicotianae]|uniref:Integrase zinc-binding domain-containing protein n=1 Tax=Phytophthora nicotianae TaxID=4792 RepID=W2J507_PHYNI|nr:hypothetical protein L916_07559 [Phytophthora nicotianae]
MIAGCLGVPNATKYLLARIFVVAHCGSQGHRGQEPMIATIKRLFYISQLSEKVVKFVQECLPCKHVKGPRLLPLPYGPLLTTTKRNEAVHLDFLCCGPGFGDTAYLLVTNDELAHLRVGSLFDANVDCSGGVARDVVREIWDSRVAVF